MEYFLCLLKNSENIFLIFKFVITMIITVTQPFNYNLKKIKMFMLNLQYKNQANIIFQLIKKIEDSLRNQ